MVDLQEEGMVAEAMEAQSGNASIMETSWPAGPCDSVTGPSHRKEFCDCARNRNQYSLVLHMLPVCSGRKELAYPEVGSAFSCL